MIAEVLCRLGSSRAFVVHGAGGIDELSPAGPNLVCEVENGAVRSRTIDPLDLGIARCAPVTCAAGRRRRTRQAIRDVLGGAAGPHRDAVLLNAAGAIAAAGHAADLAEGLALATAAIDSGSAASRLDSLVEFSRAEVAH